MLTTDHLAPSRSNPRKCQLIWGAGVAGGLYLIADKCGGQPLPLYVIHNPWAVWLVGPYFAALTGEWRSSPDFTFTGFETGATLSVQL
jgi:hypothetical protein